MEGELRKWFFSHQMWKILILKLLDSRLARVVWKDLCTHLDLHWVAPSNFPPQSQNDLVELRNLKMRPKSSFVGLLCLRERPCAWGWRVQGLERERMGFRQSPAAQWRSRSSIYSSPPSRFEPPLPQTLTQLLMQLRRMGLQNKNYFCRGREWTKFHWRQINPRLNQIWTRNGQIWNNTWLNFTINSWWMGPYTPYYTIHTLISPMQWKVQGQIITGLHPNIQFRQEFNWGASVAIGSFCFQTKQRSLWRSKWKNFLWSFCFVSKILNFYLSIF